MGNALTTVNHTLLADVALEAFVSALAPLQAFTLNASPKPADRGDKVKVLTVPNQDAAATFSASTGYQMQDADATGVDVSLNQHVYCSWALTDSEIANAPQVEVETFAKQKGFQLAKKVFQTVLAGLTSANYGTSALVHDHQIDADDIAELRGVIGALNWPEDQRALVLPSTYLANLFKDAALQNASALGDTSVIRDGVLRRVLGFNVYESNLVPNNNEHIAGFVARPEGMLVAMRYLQPAAEANIIEARAVTDPATGMTFGLRRWYNPDFGQVRSVIECVFGSAVGNNTALKAVRSQASIYS